MRTPKKLLLTLLISLFFITSCTLQPLGSTNIEFTKQDLGILSRKCFIGVSGYSPANFPSSTASQVSRFWSEVNTAADVYGVHVDWTDTNILYEASSNFDGDIELVLGFQKPEEWELLSEKYLEKLTSLLNNGKQIKYVAIGNEVNTLYKQYPDKFDKFIAAYNLIYDEIKKKFPEVKIFTTFQYELLTGKGYLSQGTERSKNQFELLEKFKDKLDLIGLTVYPYFDLNHPKQVETDYFKDLRRYTDKPIAITETGWMSRKTFGGDRSFISAKGLTGSEDEQVDYIKVLLELCNQEKITFINWLGLNDFVEWTDGDNGTKGYEVFDSIGLKKHDGSPKMAWNYWMSFKNLNKPQ